MKNPRIDYLLVGLFTLAMGAGILLAAALLSGRTGPTDDYSVHFDNAGGAKYGTQVLYEGFRVGQVEEIVPIFEGSRTRFNIRFSVREGWRIPVDSVAFLAATGLLSPISLNIEAGHSSQSAHPESRLLSRERVDPMRMVADLGQEMRRFTEEGVKPLMGRLNRTLDNVNGILEGDGKELAGRLNRLAGELADQIPAVLEKTQGFAARLEGLAGRLEGLSTQENVDRFTGMMDNLQQTTANMARLSADLHQTREQADRLLSTVNTALNERKEDVDRSLADARYVLESLAKHVDAVSRSLEETSRNMEEFSRRIRRDPSSLVWSKQPAEEMP
ncbi:MAG: MCE family protein [Magnetococcales bacterium]|nr:MCE family protein [Magnetococcales bacterium]